MKTFFEKHILFPKRYGLQPYMYLIFALPAIPVIMSAPSVWPKIFLTVLVLIFLKAYRDGYEVTRWHWLHIIVQLLLASFLIVNPWGSLYGMHTFTGFEIGFSSVSDKRYRQYLIAFYCTAIPAYLFPMVSFLSSSNLYSYVYLIIATIFAFASPVFAKSIANSYNLREENQRLESTIRQLERERIAYDLHDTLGQTFSTIALQAELAEKLVDKAPNHAKEELTKISQNARQNLHLVREIVSNLKEQNISQVLLEEAEALNLAEIVLHSEGEAQVEDWPKAIQNTLAAVLKEALTNVARHSQAQQVRVIFDEDKSDYFLTVHDNGVGLQDHRPSHGVNGMKQRLQKIGGEFLIATDKGTKLCAKVPKA